MGWKDVAASQLSLADALIDSVNDGLTVLPYSGHQDVEYGAGSSGAAENLRQLAMHYDLVLADLGVLPKASGDHSILNGIDAAVIIRSACVAWGDISHRVEQILQTSGVKIIGIAENRHQDSYEEPDGVYEAA